MACEILTSAGAILTVWGTPEVSDVARIVGEVAFAAERYRRPIVYITRVPQNAATPDAKTRREIDGMLPRVMKSCSSYHVILEGTGFVAALKRGVLTGLLQPVWRARVFFVHASVADMMKRISAPDRENVQRLLDKANLRELLTCPAISIRPKGADSAVA